MMICALMSRPAWMRMFLGLLFGCLCCSHRLRVWRDVAWSSMMTRVTPWAFESFEREKESRVSSSSLSRQLTLPNHPPSFEVTSIFQVIAFVRGRLPRSRSLDPSSHPRFRVNLFVSASYNRLFCLPSHKISGWTTRICLESASRREKVLSSVQN